MIRKRTLFELADLAVRLFRQEGAMLFPLFFVLALPFGFLNYYFLETLGPWESLDAAEMIDQSITYIILLTGIQLLQLPLVASLMIVFLGMSVFSPTRKPGIFEAVFVWFGAFGQLLFYLVLLRPFLFLLFPFLLHEIVLEKTPFFSRGEHVLSTWRRAWILHRGQFGNTLLFGGALLLFGTIITMGLCTVAGKMVGFLVEIKDETDSFLIVKTVFPFLLWGEMFFISVLQFLRYLDLRIEREGWDVELTFRAERARMKESL